MDKPQTTALAGALALTLSIPAFASTVTVTTAEDLVDFGGSQQIADLPGPDGVVSFREAAMAVNNTTGTHTIEFAVPSIPSGLLRIEGPAFVISRDGTTVDFLSQAVFDGDPDPSGPGLGILNTHPGFIGQPALVINASDCLVQGLGRTQFRDSIVIVGGHTNQLIRNFTDAVRISPSFGTTSTGNIIGGTGASDSNEIDQISLECGANDNIVIGNRIESIDVTGSPFCSEGTRRPTGNRIGGPTAAERNFVSGFGSYSGEGRPSGTGILVDYALDTIVEGNYIGVNTDGLAQADDMNRGTNGIQVRDSMDTTVRGNLISGIRGVGISGFAGQVFGRAILVIGLNDAVSGVVIEDNIIGLDANLENPILTRAGIRVVPQPHPISDVLIRNNTIAATEEFGIQLDGAGVDHVEISENSIFENGGRGIEFFGANGSPSVPVIDSAVSASSGTTVSGELNSIPDDQFRIEIFASEVCDPSGSGEGQVFLGSFVVNTDASGSADFTETVPGVAPQGWVVTATATDLTQSRTSVFSVCVTASGADCPADVTGDGEIDLADLNLVLANFGQQTAEGDATGDGEVDLADLNAVLAAFGTACS